MSCKITYKNQQYTEAQFHDYISSHPEEIANALSDKKEMLSLEEDVDGWRPSQKTIDITKEFIKRIGVDIQSSEVVFTNRGQDANGIAKLLYGIIELKNGQEWALPEEGMHFAVEIVRQTNPKLFKELINFAGESELYKTISSSEQYQKEYNNDPFLMKMETAGRLLAKYIDKAVDEQEESTDFITSLQKLWDKILQWFNTLFDKAGFDPFAEVAKTIVNNKFTGTQEDIKDVPYELFNLSSSELSEFERANPKQTATWSRLQEEKNLTKLRTLNEKGEKVHEYVRTEDGSIVKNTVSQKSKEEYKRQFGKEDEPEHSTAADVGTAIHADIETILKRATDENGFLRKGEDGRVILTQATGIPNTKSKDIYQALEENIVERLTQYPVGTRIAFETVVYDRHITKAGKLDDIAGTIDFLALFPDTYEQNADVLDWKGLNLNITKYTNIPWYKIKPFNIQMDLYTDILKKNYGIEKFGKQRMIPIVFNYAVKDGEWKITNIPLIGRDNINLTPEDYLLPIPSRKESTGNAKVDQLIKKLYSEYDALIAKKDGTPLEKRKRYESIDKLYAAIRHLQMNNSFGKFFENVSLLIDSTKEKLEQVKLFMQNTTLEEATANNDELLNQQSNLIIENMDEIRVYSQMYSTMKGVFGATPTPEEQEIVSHIKEISSEAGQILSDINEASVEFAVKYIGGKYGIEGIDQAERVITGAGRLTNSFSRIETAAGRASWRILQGLHFKGLEDITKEKKTLEEFFEKLKGKDILKYIEKKDKKGQAINQLIDEYSSDFYNTIKAKIKEKDVKWIAQNIDLQALEQLLKKVQETELSYIEDRYFPTQEDKLAAINDVLSSTRLYNENGDILLYPLLQYNWVKKVPKAELWYSPEYKELQKEPEILKFYNYIKDWNKKAAEIGYIGHDKERNFLPFIKAGIIQRFGPIKGLTTGLITKMMEEISIRPDMEGYGQINPRTGEIIDTIPKYFTTNISEEKTDSDGNKYYDYSNVSNDIIKNYLLFVTKVIDYGYKAEAEPTLKLLLNVEKNKNKLQTGLFGNVVGGEVAGNESNSQLLNELVRSKLYDQKFTTEQTDIALQSPAKLWNSIADNVKEKTGISLPKTSKEAENTKVSAMRILDFSNRAFQMTALGLKPATALIQLIGGTLQGEINAGKYYNKKDFYKAEWDFATNKIFKSEKALIQLMSDFMPIGDELRREINKLASSKWNRQGFSDIMMSLMRKADHLVQYANFLAFMKNAIVVDGQLHNAREYYRNSEEFKKAYSRETPEAERKQILKDFDTKVKELIEKHGIKELIEEKDSIVTIKGLDMKSESVIRYKSIIKAYGERIAGNISDEDQALYRKNVLLRTVAMFKNWIIPNVQTRYQKLQYRETTQSWEWGRVQTLFSIVADDLLGAIKNFNAIAKANDRGLDVLDKLYKKKAEEYYTKTGKELSMTQEEFNDLVRQNMVSNMRDIRALLAILALVLAAAQIPPPDEDDKGGKALLNYSLRFLDKAQDELGFYYNPASAETMFSGAIFPTIGLLTNVGKVVHHTGVELFGDEEAKEKAHPLKYTMRALPVANEMLNYIAFMAPDLATEMDIKVNKGRVW